MLKKPAKSIKPDDIPLNTPFWIVGGYHNCFPSIHCAVLDNSTGTVVIWGYSVYQRHGAFRTLGTAFTEYVRLTNGDLAFFMEQDDALEFLGKMITPSPETLARQATKRERM